MYFLIYSSYTNIDFTHDDLKTLLITSRERNKHVGMSGMLLYSKGKFVQLLEGEELKVKLLYAKISQDKRHQSVVVLKDGLIDERLFSKWSMAFSDVTSEELVTEEGFDKLNSTSALQIFIKLSSSI